MKKNIMHTLAQNQAVCRLAFNFFKSLLNSQKCEKLAVVAKFLLFLRKISYGSVQQIRRKTNVKYTLAQNEAIFVKLLKLYYFGPKSQVD